MNCNTALHYQHDFTFGNTNPHQRMHLIIPFANLVKLVVSSSSCHHLNHLRNSIWKNTKYKLLLLILESQWSLSPNKSAESAKFLAVKFGSFEYFKSKLPTPGSNRTFAVCIVYFYLCININTIMHFSSASTSEK